MSCPRRDPAEQSCSRRLPSWHYCSASRKLPSGRRTTLHTSLGARGVDMQHQSMDVKALVEHIDTGKIKLPEIQRSYVWKGPQVAYLLDSLYRGYPSGSLLLWATDDEVAERNSAIQPTIAIPGPWRPLYLLDGQQRITSLHRVMAGHPDTNVVFNVAIEKFQLASKTTNLEGGWVNVHQVLSGKVSLFELASQLAEATDLTKESAYARLDLLRGIITYTYQIEVSRGSPTNRSRTYSSESTQRGALSRPLTSLLQLFLHAGKAR